MLFSQPELASYLSETFECAWEELRPVPQVHIDFGNGHELHRTLNGNVATWFCTPEGEALNLIPGLVTPKAFRGLAEESAKWSEYVKGFRSYLNDAQVKRSMAELYTGEVPSAQPAPRATSGFPNHSKLRVELPIKQRMALPVASPLWNGLGPHTTPEESLELDSSYNLLLNYPAGHRMLKQRRLSDPHELQNSVFLEILQVDLADPYLGLAPEVLGGESGRIESR